MTTDAERECYYRLARDAAGKGEIVELGAWMGASTAYIAAAIRDSGVQTKAHVYDKFQSKPGHAAKVKAFYANRNLKEQIHIGPCQAEFEKNLGPLMEYVKPYPGLIDKMRWSNGPVSLLVTDAPKRVQQIAAVLSAFRSALRPGAVMAWQDFCHFPSYEIPACLYRLREHIEFVEAVVPGTTLVFRVKSQWTLEEVHRDALSLGWWTAEEVGQAWDYWAEFVPQEKAALFACGAAMFNCDIGKPGEAVRVLSEIYESHGAEIVKKWRYLREARPDFVTRYAPLFQYLERQGVFDKEAA
jgi:hypothetical protein